MRAADRLGWFGRGFIQQVHSSCRPATRDPYAVLVGQPRDFDNRRSWSCVAAKCHVHSRTALRQIVVGVKRLRIVLGLGIEPAIFDHQVDRVGHVLVGDLERPLALGFRRAVERDRQLKALRQRLDLAALRIGVEDRLRRALRRPSRRLRPPWSSPT